MIGRIERMNVLTLRMRNALLLQERAMRKMVDVLEVHAYALGTADRKMVEDIKEVRDTLGTAYHTLVDK